MCIYAWISKQSLQCYRVWRQSHSFPSNGIIESTALLRKRLWTCYEPMDTMESGVTKQQRIDHGTLPTVIRKGITRKHGWRWKATDKLKNLSERIPQMSGLQDCCNSAGRTPKPWSAWSKGTLLLTTTNTKQEELIAHTVYSVGLGTKQQGSSSVIARLWDI